MLNPDLIRALVDDRERAIVADLRRRRMLDDRADQTGRVKGEADACEPTELHAVRASAARG